MAALKMRVKVRFPERPDSHPECSARLMFSLLHLVLECCSFLSEALCGSTLAGYSSRRRLSKLG